MSNIDEIEQLVLSLQQILKSIGLDIEIFTSMAKLDNNAAVHIGLADDINADVLLDLGGVQFRARKLGIALMFILGTSNGTCRVQSFYVPKLHKSIANPCAACKSIEEVHVIADLASNGN